MSASSWTPNCPPPSSTNCGTSWPSAGFLTKGKRNTFALTDAGRERALRFLGVAELPAADELVNRDRQVPVPQSRRALERRGGQAE